LAVCPSVSEPLRKLGFYDDLLVRRVNSISILGFGIVRSGEEGLRETSLYDCIRHATSSVRSMSPLFTPPFPRKAETNYKN
jgi:hypothetical protein